MVLLYASARALASTGVTSWRSAPTSREGPVRRTVPRQGRSAADVPTSPVLELHDAVKTEQVRHNGAVRTLPGGAQVAACPVRAAQWDDAPGTPAPRLGADTNEVLRALLGLQGAELTALAERNVIGVAE